MRTFLEKDGFIFVEEDKAFDVYSVDVDIRKVQTRSLFWSHKHLSEPFPPSYSIVIKGEIRKDDKGSVIETEIIELHGNREHPYGGTKAIDEYFRKLCKIFGVV